MGSKSNKVKKLTKLKYRRQLQKNIKSRSTTLKNTNTSASTILTPSKIEQPTEESLNFIKEAETEFEPVTKLIGRRIVDVNYVFQQMQEKARHNNLFDCGMSNFCLIGEKRIGLISHFKFQCNMCKEICVIQSENTDDTGKVNLNIAATTGIVASGNGFSQFEELCSAMDVPVFSPNYYNKLQNEVYEKWEQTAVESMSAAAKKEKEIAIAEDRTKNGYPVIDVYVDGAWCARSYGINFKASSGTAAIIGRRTGQVLFMGTKNKYCYVCARAENKDVAPKEHICFKNFKGSSGSMEAEIITEGFKLSIPMYGLIYGRVIGDGDASTYAKILKANPYENQNLTVEKIECRNHILRNLCKKLRGLTTDTKYALVHRKTLSHVRIMTMRKVIVNSITHHKKSDCSKHKAITLLHNDIINSVSHAYGDHRMCHSYYCDKNKNDSGELKKIQNSTFIFRINAIMSNVAAKARSLVEDVDTNAVESFNSVIAKFVGGKRINFSLKRGYQGRCSATVVAFNSKSALSSVHRAFTNKNPGGEIERVEIKRAKKRTSNKEHPIKKRRKLRADIKQNDYGPSSSAPDLSKEELENAIEQFIKNLKTLTADRYSIERSTILQRDSSEWMEIRKHLITASNFGPVCKRRITTNTAPLVSNILYKKNLAHVASIAHGIEHEQQALQQLQQQENVKILPCGLFIDKVHPFIGATPDGLIQNDTLVEVKCPISAVKIGLSQAIQENKIQILKHDKKKNTTTINKLSNWYYQIQGQLHVTERRVCLLGIWAGESEIKVYRIERDDQFWITKMEPKLVKFYFECLLPEIVDSRQARGLPIRNLTLSEGKQNLDNTKSHTSQSRSKPHSDLQVLTPIPSSSNGDLDENKENVDPDDLSTHQIHFYDF